MNSRVFLSEFTLLPEGKEALRRFLDAHYDALCGRTALPKKGLMQLLKEVLPEEVQCNLKRMFEGNSEYAILIHNFPERSGIEYLPRKKIRPSSFYSYHILNKWEIIMSRLLILGDFIAL